jgi:FtsP/CotA-like multicopper oxidase with cupredoxin domain
MPSSGQVRLLDTEISGAQTPIEHFFNPDGNRLMAGSLRFGSGAAPELVSAADQAPLFDLTNYGSGFVPSTTPPDMVTPLVLAEGPGIRDGWPQLVHTINGQASPYVPPIQVQLGQTVQLHIVNDTDEFHPMHLHGHVMSVLSKNGVPLNGSPVQLDTVMVGPRETWDVQFVADNPGVWMVHCHVLLHAAMGMSETITYNGVYTPFEMGTRSGNIPE